MSHFQQKITNSRRTGRINRVIDGTTQAVASSITGSVQVDNAIIEIDISPLQYAGLIDPEICINHQDEDISRCLLAFILPWVFGK
jgi:hypothetical protein